jgi:hypothetical protein
VVGRCGNGESGNWGRVTAEEPMRRGNGQCGALYAGRRRAARPPLSPRLAKATAERVERALARMSRERLLPDEKTPNKVTRYEAHLSQPSTS